MLGSFGIALGSRWDNCGIVWGSSWDQLGIIVASFRYRVGVGWLPMLVIFILFYLCMFVFWVVLSLLVLC